MMCHIMKIIKEDFDIVLTGAGTSEFIGNSLYQALNGKYGYKVKSYATTDIVPSPEAFLSRTKPTILVSFGRSGNSPETVGAVDAAEVVCQNLYHLFITCNHKGTLSKVAEDRAHCHKPDTGDPRPVLCHDLKIFQHVYGSLPGIQSGPSGGDYL